MKCIELYIKKLIGGVFTDKCTEKWKYLKLSQIQFRIGLWK